MKPSAAFATAVLFSTQPLLWGHTFINPKDPPFLTLFLPSVCLGFEMVDKLVDDLLSQEAKNHQHNSPCNRSRITTSIRVLGSLAGLLVFIYLVSTLIQNQNTKSYLPLTPSIGYGVFMMLAMFVTWPYLWENPLTNFMHVFRLMSDKPTQLPVLFGGEVYHAGELPRRYLLYVGCSG